MALRKKKAQISAPYMPWWPGDFLKSTRGWHIIARGCYRELLDHQWDSGSLPADPEKLRLIVANISCEDWQIAWEAIESKFPISPKDGQRRNPRCDLERVHVFAILAAKSRGGKSSRKNNLGRVIEESAQDSMRYPDPDPEPDKKKDIPIPSESVSVSPIFDHWKITMAKPRAKLDAKRKKLIAARLKDYSEEDLRQAISGYQNSPHHMGGNENGTRYDSIELILRDSKHVDAGLEFFRNPPRTDISAKTKKIITQTQDWKPPEQRRNGT
jgi:uncharacterized protein YdaU (DUF1376 family)